MCQGGFVSPVLFSLYVSYVLAPSHHIKLPLYVDDMILIVTFCRPSLHVIYLEAYLGRLEY